MQLSMSMFCHNFISWAWERNYFAYCCCCSVIQSSLTLCDSMSCSRPGLLVLTIVQSFSKLMSIQSVMPSNHLILCHPFSSCLQSFPASRSFLMSLFFVSGDQSFGGLVSSSVLSMNIQNQFPLGLSCWISL